MPLYPTRFSDTADGLVPAPNSGGATNFLREDGTWQAAGGSGATGSLVYLEHQDASASANISFALDSYTDYRGFMIVIENLLPATDNVELWVRFSTDGGSTFDANVSDYQWSYTGVTLTTGISTGDAADSEITIAEQVSNAANETLSGVVWVFDPHTAGNRTSLVADVRLINQASNPSKINAQGVRLAQQDTTDIRFLMSSGNITSGRFILYGLSLTSVPGGNPDAADVVFTPAGTIAATDVQAAIEEVALDADVLNGNSVLQIITDCTAMPATSGQYAGDFGVQFAGTGTQVISATTDVGQTNRPGIMQLELGTTTTGRAAIRTNIDTFTTGGGELIYEADVRIEDLSDATNEYDLRVGFGDSDTGDHTDGCYFEYDRNSSTNWNMVVAGAATRTRTATATAVAADTWYKLRITVNAAGNSVRFDINGSQDASSPLTGANIPTGFAERFGAGVWAVKSAGTTERIAYVDRILVKQTLTTPR